MKSPIVTILTILSITFFTACTSKPTSETTSPETPSLQTSDTAITGTVTSVDYTPMAADGDAIILIQTAEDQTYTVLIPARINLCQASFPDTELQVGNNIQVSGDSSQPNTIRPCESPDHFLTIINNANPNQETTPTN